MNYDNLELVLDRKTAEKLYSFLFRYEKELESDLIILMDKMEKECFAEYSIDKMKELTGGKDY
ncbi:MAG: hypothetical protein JXA95_04565 [Spirochaetales bacterium]|nr:hypothetical protein [Spirochaetales bacterium]